MVYSKKPTGRSETGAAVPLSDQLSRTLRQDNKSAFENPNCPWLINLIGYAPFLIIMPISATAKKQQAGQIQEQWPVLVRPLL